MDFDSDDEPSDSDDSSASMEEMLLNALQMIKENEPQLKELIWSSNYDYIQNMTDEEWEELGRDIANNTHLTKVELNHRALNNNRVSFLFRGLTRSSSMKELQLDNNYLDTIGVRSIVPFLQNATNLTELDLSGNSLQSEGFNFLLRALRGSPIKELMCRDCAIESIEIDIEHTPRHLRALNLIYNSINAAGCRELAKLLQGGNATLKYLYPEDNEINDEGVEVLVDALRNNTTLAYLVIGGNDDISNQGKIKLLKLVNDVSSIEATLQSNHTLSYLSVEPIDEQIQMLIDVATKINSDNRRNPEAAGREKVIWTQLHSETRAELAELQGVNHSVYSEIDPLHLPEVLALVGHHHGHGELYIALKSSIAGVISTVNRKACIRQQMAYHEEKLKELSSELAAIEAAEGVQGDGGGRSKRRRAC